jgi:hypothetical protein
MSDADYDTLEKFIQTVLRRVAEGKATILDAEQDVMHPLTAWDHGNAQEFAPWMKATMMNGRKAMPRAG